jgi:hypothetical protein
MFGKTAPFLMKTAIPSPSPVLIFSQIHQSSTATAESFGNADEQTTEISETQALINWPGLHGARYLQLATHKPCYPPNTSLDDCGG